MIDYTHKVNSRAKSLKLAINKSGEVVVTTPRFIPQVVVRAFVQQHAQWISEQRVAINAKKTALDLSSDTILLFGTPHKIEVDHNPRAQIGVRAEHSRLIITPIDHTTASQQKALERYLKTTAKQFILEKLEHWATTMDITYHQVAFKQQSTRWGSCSSAGNLNFNWRLVHAPTAVIEYVIIHELAHRVHMDHSRAFWQLVERYDSEYRIHRGWLKRNGMALG